MVLVNARAQGGDRGNMSRKQAEQWKAQKAGQTWDTVRVFAMTRGSVPLTPTPFDLPSRHPTRALLPKGEPVPHT